MPPVLPFLAILPLFAAAPEAAAADDDVADERARAEMVERQLVPGGIRDRRVLDAMRTVPRHRFVPPPLRARAYDDSALPIGRGQTISQPLVVALMAEALALRGGERVLEVGSGSGYAAAVLARLAADVHGIELEPELHHRAAAVIEALGYRNVHLRAGDGFHGWPEAAPFDAIVISCSTERLPDPLWEQLAPGGRVVYPRRLPDGHEELLVVTKTPEGPRERSLGGVRFVPLRRAPR